MPERSTTRKRSPATFSDVATIATFGSRGADGPPIRTTSGGAAAAVPASPTENNNVVASTSRRAIQGEAYARRSARSISAPN